MEIRLVVKNNTTHNAEIAKSIDTFVKKDQFV